MAVWLACCALASLACCRRSPKPPPASVDDIALGEMTTCARLAGGHAMCWGISNQGIVVSKVAPDRRRYVPITGPESDYYPQPVSAEVPPSARALVLGETHGCALLADGGVQCWGGNQRCQLGTGKSDADRHLPTPVPGVAGATAIASGNHQTCVVAGGAVRCWGQWDPARSDAAACSARDAVATAPGAPVTAVAVGQAHACALRGDGTVWCWGENDTGQLGLGTLTRGFQAAVRPVVGLGDVREIAASARTTCALRGDGSAWCWGANGYGQLGSSDTLDRGTAAPVRDLFGATQVAVGATHACALVAGGEVRCWGGKLAVGDGGDQNRLAAVSVSRLKGMRRVVLGGGPTMSHSCAIGGDGLVWCWGSNFFGQLGDGSTDASPVPVRVAW